MKKIIAFLVIFSLITACKEQVNIDKQTAKAVLLTKDDRPIPLPKDKLIVVNFFAYSCTTCMKEMPVLKKVITQDPKFKDKFVIIGIAIDSDKDDLSDPLFPKYANNRKNFVRFPVPGTPTTYIIDYTGKKYAVIYGAMPEEQLRKVLTEALQKYEKQKEKNEK
ncbi:MAG: TlpA family protein disulfide reductase [Aquificae bacterium]|nr:TlpA family protein disulfide reductase [Aquificota bacterium]